MVNQWVKDVKMYATPYSDIDILHIDMHNETSENTVYEMVSDLEVGYLYFVKNIYIHIEPFIAASGTHTLLCQAVNHACAPRQVAPIFTVTNAYDENIELNCGSWTVTPSEEKPVGSSVLSYLSQVPILANAAGEGNYLEFRHSFTDSTGRLHTPLIGSEYYYINVILEKMRVI